MEPKYSLDFLSYLYDNKKSIFNHFKKKEFLNEDVRTLLEHYDEETIVSNEVPYVTVYKFYNGNSETALLLANKIHLSLEKDKFHLKNNKSTTIESFQSRALDAFKNKMSNDGSIVRLSKYTFNKENELVEMTMQHAKYSDQVKSNLTLDWDSHGIKNFTTLRDYLKVIHGSVLPPISSELLANTIGISCILYFKSGENYIPYLPKRTKYKFIDISTKKSLAIFEGGFHVTASGALNFPLNYKAGDLLTFNNFFTEEMYREVYEEVGIKKADIAELIPLALTRELLRAGKPQIFFAGILKDSITEDDLKSRRNQSIKRQRKNKNEKIEIENKSLKIYSTEDLIKEAPIHGLTLEAVGNLFFSKEYKNDKQKLLTI